jgi:hypothetical protein
MDNLFKEYKGVFEAEAPTREAVGGSTEKVGQKKERVFGYSPFALQDALGERNVKKAWIEYEKLRLADIEAEELIHKIVAKIRDMVAISAGASKEDLGLKDYPFTKSRKDIKNWKEENLKDLYTKLVTIYHQSHMGARLNGAVGQGDELDVAIEKILLSI